VPNPLKGVRAPPYKSPPSSCGPPLLLPTRFGPSGKQECTSFPFTPSKTTPSPPGRRRGVFLIPVGTGWAPPCAPTKSPAFQHESGFLTGEIGPAVPALPVLFRDVWFLGPRDCSHTLYGPKPTPPRTSPVCSGTPWISLINISLPFLNTFFPWKCPRTPLPELPPGITLRTGKSEARAGGPPAKPKISGFSAKPQTYFPSRDGPMH